MPPKNRPDNRPDNRPHDRPDARSDARSGNQHARQHDEASEASSPDEPQGLPPGAGSAASEPQPDENSLGAVASRLGPASVLAAVWLFLPALGSIAVFWKITDISAWFREHQTMGPILYAAAFIVAAGIGVLPTYSQAFLGGWAFGPVVGTIAALCGFVGASVIGYAIARPVGKERVEAELERHPKWRVVRDALVRSGPLRTLGIVTLVRIPPNSPFSLTNLVLTTTGVPLWAYLIGTAVGMLPRTAVVVWLASQIEGELTKEAIKGARPGWVIAASVAVAVVIFVVLFEIGKRAIARATRDPASPQAKQPPH
ncbi:MAG: TVP38/TMEM64 family protein [Planctomycetota bacterium]